MHDADGQRNADAVHQRGCRKLRSEAAPDVDTGGLIRETRSEEGSSEQHWGWGGAMEEQLTTKLSLQTFHLYHVDEFPLRAASKPKTKLLISAALFSPISSASVPSIVLKAEHTHSFV